MTESAGPAGGEVVLYEAPDGDVRLDVRLERETVWLPLAGMAALFDRHKSVISRHLRGVFASGEVDRASAVAKNATTAADGKTYQVEHFNLDAILSVGYRGSPALPTTPWSLWRSWSPRASRARRTSWSGSSST